MIEIWGDLVSCGVIVFYLLSFMLFFWFINIIMSNKDYKISGGGGRGCVVIELGLDLN